MFLSVRFNGHDHVECNCLLSTKKIPTRIPTFFHVTSIHYPLFLQFIDLVNPENSRCVQCDGTGYIYLEETGQCQDPQAQFVDKR